MQTRRQASRVQFRALVVTMLAAALACVAFVGTAEAQSGSTELICEATGNPSAPYVEIKVNQSDLPNYSPGEGDIIPAPASGCPTAAGVVAPTETTTTTATAVPTTTTTTTTLSTVTTTSESVHKKKKKASSGDKGTSTPLAPVNPVVTTTTTTSSETSEVAAAATPIRTLPRTGGQVPLTIVLGLLALFGGAMMRGVAVRPRTGRGRSGS
jgi:hypothetical protein